MSILNLKIFSRCINNITAMRRYILITEASQRDYATGTSQEKPSWTQDRETGYFKPETKTKELDPYNIVTISESEVKTRNGEELWWMPDTQTGIYRPVDTFVRELDAVELRSMHLNGE